MELLVYDVEKKELTISPEAREFSAFKGLIRKHKEQANQLLAFVHLVEHPLSPFQDIEPKKREEKLAEFLEVDIPMLDRHLIEARSVYKEVVRSARSDTVDSIRKGLFSAMDLIDRSSDLLRMLLDETDEKKMNSAKGKADAIKNLKDANDLLDNILDKAAKVPKVIETLDSLSQKLKKEMATTRRNVRGKGELNPFEE